MKLKLPERRRFIRIEIPLRLRITDGNRIDEIITKNVSPVGLRFELEKELDPSRQIDVSLYLPTFDDAILLKTKIIWQTRTSLEDNAPYDVGVEIVSIEDKNKNVFLKYLCDLLYDSSYKARI